MSPRSYFVFTPLLNDTAVGTLEFRAALEPVRRNQPGIGFIQAWADDVDLVNKRIRAEASLLDPRVTTALISDRTNHRLPDGSPSPKGPIFDLDSDKLVIAVGCYSQTFDTKGVKENAFFLKDIGDATKIRTRILQLFEMASLPGMSEEHKRHLLHFAIVGRITLVKMIRCSCNFFNNTVCRCWANRNGICCRVVRLG